jgi:hypothetical protein
MLGTIALWWCYLTGGALAWGFTICAAWWAFDLTATRIGWAKQIWDWRRNRNTILSEKRAAK